MGYIINESNNIRFVEVGNKKGSTLVLLHGLFGALSNFEHLIKYFMPKYRIGIPLLPIFELPVREINLQAFVGYVERFINMMGYQKVHVLGNSLGGHIALLYALENPNMLASMTLTGSSGLFENNMGSSYPHRKDYEFVKERTKATFYDGNLATKDLVDEVYSMLNDRHKVIRLIATSKSALRNNVAERLPEIETPTLLVWGKQDSITPPFVGEKFKECIKNAELVFLDKCGHAPMMERPKEFNSAYEKFLHKIESYLKKS